MSRTLAIIKYLASIHISALAFLSVFRLILYITNMHLGMQAADRSTQLFNALLKGIQFDNTIACYILAAPLLVLTILSLFNITSRISIKICNIYFIIFYALIFAISVSDIPYFSYFYSHMGGGIFNWVGTNGGALKMLLQESSYYIYFLLYIISVLLFIIVVQYFGRRLLNAQTRMIAGKKYIAYIPLVVAVWGLCFLGVRGGISRYPIKVSNAYFCNNSFINQLGVNPAFYFIKSSTSFFKKQNALDNIMDTEEAIQLAQEELGIAPVEGFPPLYRQIESDPNREVKDANVVIILMESMSSAYMDITYNGKSITPFLNSLKSQSYYFNNFYSAGIHTNNGIAATLYGHVPQFNKTMMSVDIDRYNGLPQQLKENNYYTSFFITGNPNFDNMASFLYENGFDKVYSQDDYPREKRVNNFGVPDEYLFEYGVHELSEISNKHKKFLATFMTVSNHPPLIIPPAFADRGSSDEERIVAYADHCIEKFLTDASKESWYNNTIFVILGDHGRTIGNQIYNMPISYNHIPLFIYSPLFKDKDMDRCDQFGGQVDVFPTVMGLLNRPYENISLGIDLFKEKRPCMYFVSDNHLGCVDNDFFYCYDVNEKKEGLYSYRNNDPNNKQAQYTARADSLRTYAVSMMRTSDYMVKNKLTSAKGNNRIK